MVHIKYILLINRQCKARRDAGGKWISISFPFVWCILPSGPSRATVISVKIETRIVPPPTTVLRCRVWVNLRAKWAIVAARPRHICGAGTRYIFSILRSGDISMKRRSAPPSHRLAEAIGWSFGGQISCPVNKLICISIIPPISNPTAVRISSLIPVILSRSFARFKRLHVALGDE